MESDYKPATRVAKYEAVDELNDLSNFFNETIGSLPQDNELHKLHPELKIVLRDKIKSIQKIVREM